MCIYKNYAEILEFILKSNLLSLKSLKLKNYIELGIKYV